MAATAAQPDVQVRGLTVRHPAMFAALTLSPPQLRRLEAVAVTVHQGAADSLEIRRDQANSMLDK